jgi:hypothetical protein
MNANRDIGVNKGGHTQKMRIERFLDPTWISP